MKPGPFGEMLLVIFTSMMLSLESVMFENSL